MKKLFCSLLCMFASLSAMAAETDNKFQLEREKSPTLRATSENIGVWDKATLTYRFSNFGVKMMRDSFLGRGIGMEYHPEKNVTVWGASLRNRDTGEKVPTIGIKIIF
jgi:hypothetical protein